VRELISALRISAEVCFLLQCGRPEIANEDELTKSGREVKRWAL